MLSTNFIVFSYYTKDTPYEQEIKGLEESLNRLSIPYDFKAIESRGSWIKNCGVKPTICKEMYHKYSDKAIVYIDADAVVKSYPYLFERIYNTCDIAVHYRKDFELLAGTIYFNHTITTSILLDTWERKCKIESRTFDQINLDKAIKKMGIINLYNLPGTYCKIFDLMKEVGEGVIEHYQASRKYRKLIV